MSKIESSISFKCSEEFETRLMNDCAKLDISKSDFIRAALMLGAPILLDKPYLLYALNRNKARG
jgi:hypothetical protein